ncbi:MAG: serine hydrolase [Enterobacterales bacterium]|nr:serine hydrolase [Enterobacterales bacterium]
MARIALLLICLISYSGFSLAKKPSHSVDSIEQLLQEVSKTYQVPGIAIGILKQDKILYAKGFGLADFKSGQGVSQQTLFKIASNSKAFTAAALAFLVDQNRLAWDDKVIRYLPDFQMQDPWVTQEFNIRDLLTHRSGLGLGAGDLMLWPEPTRFTRQDIVHNLRFLKPVASFRDAYAYDNLLYIVAGEVVARISGMSWEAFVEKNLFKPLGMKHCYAGGVPLDRQQDLAAPHAVVNGKLELLEVSRINNQSSLMAAAGGIKCSLEDLLIWANFMLDDPLHKGAKNLLSSKQKQTLQQGITPLPISNRIRKQFQVNYRSYALGWRVSNYGVEHLVSHTGSLAGFMSRIILLPRKKSAIVILTNQQSSEARRVLSYGLLEALLADFPEDKNWFKDYQVKVASKPKSNKINRPKIESPRELAIVKNCNNHSRLGFYQDPWFGKIQLTRQKEQIIFLSEMSPRMLGKVYVNKKGRWWVKWDNRSFEADAWLIFDDKKDQAQLKMRAISSKTDFSFDFQDLSFVKLKQTNCSQVSSQP